MEDDNNDGEIQEKILNFALLVKQQESKAIKQLMIHSVNEGISEAEIIVIVESWLEL
ncbi:hypothetical protein HZA96_00245 [Candidatus Woesearchaeota archaeon]|nr:hypothetical protein [Candidatus Woesearchaeota archaeon]